MSSSETDKIVERPYTSMLYGFGQPTRLSQQLHQNELTLT